jgi:hypothetical protein
MSEALPAWCPREIEPELDWGYGKALRGGFQGTIFLEVLSQALIDAFCLGSEIAFGDGD